MTESIHVHLQTRHNTLAKQLANLGHVMTISNLVVLMILNWWDILMAGNWNPYFLVRKSLKVWFCYHLLSYIHIQTLLHNSILAFCNWFNMRKCNWGCNYVCKCTALQENRKNVNMIYKCDQICVRGLIAFPNSQLW